MASPLKRQPDFEDGRALSRFITGAGGAAGRTSNGANSNLSAQHLIEPNAIRIAIDASSGDCVHHLLNAVLDEKVRGAGAGQGQGQCARQGACGKDRATTSEGQDRRILGRGTGHLERDRQCKACLAISHRYKQVVVHCQ